MTTTRPGELGGGEQALKTDASSSGGAGTASVQASIGTAVRAARTGAGVSLRQLAGWLSVSPATVSAIENGQTGVSSVRLAEMAALLQVPVEHLLPVAPAERAARGPAAGHPAARVPADGPALPLVPDWRVYGPLDLDAPLRAALSAFLEYGYHGSTMRNIAQEAGLSVPGVYHHYPSKQALLVTLLERAMTELLARSHGARDEGADPAHRFALLVECLVHWHTHRRDYGVIGLSERRSLEPDMVRRVVSMRRAQQTLIDDEVEQAVAEGTFRTPHPHEAARAVSTMCTAITQWWRADGSSPPERIAADYVRFALDLMECEPSVAEVVTRAHDERAQRSVRTDVADVQPTSANAVRTAARSASLTPRSASRWR